MHLPRRNVLKAAAAAALWPALGARAADKMPLRINLLGYALGIHMPTTAAVLGLLPGMGYAPQINRMDQMRTLTQTLVAGAAELGETDPITTISAVESGADLKIIGLWHLLDPVGLRYVTQFRHSLQQSHCCRHVYAQCIAKKIDAQRHGVGRTGWRNVIGATSNG